MGDKVSLRYLTSIYRRTDVKWHKSPVIYHSSCHREMTERRKYCIKFPFTIENIFLFVDIFIRTCFELDKQKRSMEKIDNNSIFNLLSTIFAEYVGCEYLFFTLKKASIIKKGEYNQILHMLQYRLCIQKTLFSFTSH